MPSNSSDSRTGCSRRSSGRVNFRKPCTTPSSRRISLSMISDVLERALGRRRQLRRRASTSPSPPAATAAGCGAAAQARRCGSSSAAARGGSSSRSAGSSPRGRCRPSAGRAPPACASRRSSTARATCRRRCAPRAARPPARRRCRSIACVISSSSVSPSRLACTGPRDCARGQRLLDERAVRMAGRQQPTQIGWPIGVGRQRRLHRRVAEEQLARRVEQRHRVLEVLDRRLQVGLLSGELRAIGGQLLADGLKNVPSSPNSSPGGRSSVTPNSPWPSRVRPLRIT